MWDILSLVLIQEFKDKLCWDTGAIGLLPTDCSKESDVSVARRRDHATPPTKSQASQSLRRREYLYVLGAYGVWYIPHIHIFWWCEARFFPHLNSHLASYRKIVS